MTTSKKKTPEMKRLLTITSKVDGFRRCGVAHPGKPTTYDMDSPEFPFSGDQLEVLAHEPMLIIHAQEVPGTDEQETDA
ncbi:HI1506-related protein [Paremcibacter congregatus]|uniref:HI1506-related protein n=1 Tax=Paremcibacter congregatus TaxID=2043170 RepID=UPI0030EE8E8C|tara:strand:+ start:7780 stop:8016 length:237 start_codon:yes stop_codon:yes gene_type:complete